MLQRQPQQPRLWSSHACAKNVARWFLCASMIVVLNLSPLFAASAGGVPSSAGGDFLASLGLGLLLVVVALVAWVRSKAVRKELEKVRELAEHREYERNLAQRELVRRLEEERELAKEKLQFEAQLAEYEKYASLAQLALGGAHEINNPLLGIMSHLELEWKQASGEQRMEVEQ